MVDIASSRGWPTQSLAIGSALHPLDRNVRKSSARADHFFSCLFFSNLRPYPPVTFEPTLTFFGRALLQARELGKGVEMGIAVTERE